MPKRGKAGNLHMRQRGKIWWYYAYDEDGKKYGRSLRTSSRIEANEKMKEIRAKLTIAKAKKHLSAEEAHLQTYGFDQEEQHASQLRELIESEEGQRIRAAIEAEHALKHRVEVKRVELEKKQHNPKVSDFWPVYLDHYSKHLRPNTVKCHRSAWRKLLSVSNPKRLGDINTALMRRFLAKCAEQGMSEQSAYNYAAWIQGIITKAIECDLYHGDRLQLPKERSSGLTNRTVRDALTREQRDSIIETSKPNQPLYLAVCLCSYAGLRKGEACNLCWEDVDFNTNRLLVRARGDFRPKNGKDRGISLSPTLKDILLPLREETGYIIDPSKSRKSLDNSMGRMFRKVADGVGLDWCVLHTLRHTFGSILLTEETAMIWVSRWMGHSSIQITVDTYGHLMQDGQEHISKL